MYVEYRFPRNAKHARDDGKHGWAELFLDVMETIICDNHTHDIYHTIIYIGRVL